MQLRIHKWIGSSVLARIVLLLSWIFYGALYHAGMAIELALQCHLLIKWLEEWYKNKDRNFLNDRLASILFKIEKGDFLISVDYHSMPGGRPFSDSGRIPGWQRTVCPQTCHTLVLGWSVWSLSDPEGWYKAFDLQSIWSLPSCVTQGKSLDSFEAGMMKSAFTSQGCHEDESKQDNADAMQTVECRPKGGCY